MCGIVGILGKQPVALQVVDALKRLEYRGYDSAGVRQPEPTVDSRGRPCTIWRQGSAPRACFCAKQSFNT